MTERERLVKRLVDMGVNNFHVSTAEPDDPDYRPFTQDELIAEMHQLLDCIEAGAFEDITLTRD